MKAAAKNILIAVDGSEQAFEAVRYVAGLVPPDRARVTLYHVLNRVPESYLDLEAHPGFRSQVIGVHAWEFQQRKLVQDFMERARKLLRNAGYPKDSIVPVLKDREVGVARDIIREARNGYDALFVGRKGLSRVKDLLFGSVANKIVNRLSEVPVWVIGGRPSPHRVLLAADRSEGAARAMDYVANLISHNEKFEQALLVHVIRGLHTFLMGFESLVVPMEEADWQERAKQEFATAETEMRAFFEDTVRTWEKRGIDPSRVSGKILHGPSRAQCIVDEAARGGYGTVVVGRKGATRVEEFFMGRVSTKVLQMATEMAVCVVA